MNKTLRNAVAGNLALWSLALTLSCGCLCGHKRDFGSVGSAPSRSPGQTSGRPGELWRFVVSGDSRNCGDVIMPAIAAGAKKDGAKFYWHLGDLRAIYDFDEDMVQVAKDKHLTISDYQSKAWDDFTANQIAPFNNIPRVRQKVFRAVRQTRIAGRQDYGPKLSGGRQATQAQCC